tara:strand:+ start:1019 stop:3427 length:2409 start_codon:yes stop_codon:yes gene_type:complete
MIKRIVMRDVYSFRALPSPVTTGEVEAESPVFKGEAESPVTKGRAESPVTTGHAEKTPVTGEGTRTRTRTIPKQPPLMKYEYSDVVDMEEGTSYPNGDVDILQSLTSIGMQLFNDYDTEKPDIKTLPPFLSEVWSIESLTIPKQNVPFDDRVIIERVQSMLLGVDLYKFGVMTNTSGLATEYLVLKKLGHDIAKAYMNVVLQTYNDNYAKCVRQMISDIEPSDGVVLQTYNNKYAKCVRDMPPTRAAAPPPKYSVGARVLVKHSSGAETPGVVVKYDAAKYIVHMGRDGRKAVPLAGLREDTDTASPPPPLPLPTRLPAPDATTTQANDEPDDRTSRAAAVFTEGLPPFNLSGNPSTVCDAVFEGLTTLKDLHVKFYFNGDVNHAYLESRVSLLVYMVGKLGKNARWRWKGFLLQQYMSLKNTHGHRLVPGNIAAGKALVERDRLQDRADILKRFYYVSTGGHGPPGPFAWWFTQQRAYRQIVQDRHWRRVRAADQSRLLIPGGHGNGGGVMTDRAKAIVRFNYHTQIGKLVNCFKKVCKRNILNIDSGDHLPGVLPRRHSLGIMVNRFERYINEIENVVDDFTACFCRTSNSIRTEKDVAAHDGDEVMGLAAATTLTHKRGGYRSHHVTEGNAVGLNYPCVVLGRNYCDDNSPNDWYAFCANGASAAAWNSPIVWRALIRRFNWCLRHQFSFSPLSRSARITHIGTLMRIYMRDDNPRSGYEVHNYDYWSQFRHMNPIFRDSIDFRLKYNQNIVPEIYPIMQLPTSHDAADQGHHLAAVVSGRTSAVATTSMIDLLIRMYN